MGITINKETCIGCGACVALCPNTFQLNQEEGRARVINQDDLDCARNAATSCPVQAIEVSD